MYLTPTAQEFSRFLQTALLQSSEHKGSCLFARGLFNPVGFHLSFLAGCWASHEACLLAWTQLEQHSFSKCKLAPFVLCKFQHTTVYLTFLPVCTLLHTFQWQLSQTKVIFKEHRVEHCSLFQTRCVQWVTQTSPSKNSTVVPRIPGGISLIYALQSYL